jgi:hypothetical protein
LTTEQDEQKPVRVAAVGAPREIEAAASVAVETRFKFGGEGSGLGAELSVESASWRR